MKGRIKKNISIVIALLISIVSLILIGYLSFIVQGCAYNKTTSERLYKSGIEKTGLIRFEGENNADEKNAFWQEILENKSIVSTADFISIGVELGKLGEIQGTHQDEPSYASSGWAEVTFIDKDIFNICDISLTKGSINPSDYSLKNDEIGLYLGCKYKGKVSENESFVIDDVTYRVLGFIEKDQIIPSHRLQGFKVSHVSNIDECDYKIIALKGKRDDRVLLGSVLLFSVDDDSSFLDTKNSILDIAQKRDVEIIVTSVKEMINDESNNSMQDFKIFLIVIILFIIFTLYSNVFIRIMRTPSEKKAKTVLKNIMLALLAFIISGIVLYGILWVNLDTGSDKNWIIYTMQKVMIERTLPIMLLSNILISFLILIGVKFSGRIARCHRILFIIFIVLIVVCGVFSVVKMGVNVGDRTLPEFILDNFVYVVTIIGNIMATIYLVIVPKNNGIETERSIVKS